MKTGQKKHDVHKISARNSGAGNGCANFMGGWHLGFFLLENPHAHRIPRLRGGVVFFWRRGGGSANFIFMGVGIFPREGLQMFKTCLRWRLLWLFGAGLD